MNKNIFINQIKAASKTNICDLVIKNITVIDVFQSDCFVSDVAIKDGFIVGLGEYEGIDEINGTGKFICPGLIDAHAHIESSLTTPNEYYKSALIHGITSVIADPHEIANVLGIDGINLMLDLSENIPFDFYFMLSSCVPSTSFETSGSTLGNNDLSPLYDNPKVLGLAEVMNYPAVLNCDGDMINKIWTAKNKGLVIDGHGAGFDESMLNVYATANILTDHECHTTKEVINRLRRGMYVLIREGSVAKNLKDLISIVSISNSRRICLCTDDKHIDDLKIKGSIDESIRFVIESGIKAETAIQMATLNTSECYKLNHKGAITPGYIADFIILDNLQDFTINSVYKKGKLVVKENKLLSQYNYNSFHINTPNSINTSSLSIEDFKINIENKQILNVIEIIPNKLESKHLKIDIKTLQNNTFFHSDTNKDLIKIAVIERHNATGNIGLGILHGINLKEGAIATTIAHDSHNIIVCGCNDTDMLFAVNELKKLGGGIIVVSNEKILSSIQLEIGGLITARESKHIISSLNKLHQAIKIVAPNINFNPFLTLSFLSLPVIPTLKITDKGLFDVSRFNFINVAD